MSAALRDGQTMSETVVVNALAERALQQLGVPARLIAAGALAATVDLVRTRALSVEAAAEGVARTLHAAEWQPQAYAARPVPPATVVIFRSPETPTGEKPSQVDEIAHYAETVLGTALLPWQRRVLSAVAEGRDPFAITRRG